MNSFVRTLVYILSALFLLLAAFSGGYWFRGRTDLVMVASPGAVVTGAPDEATKVWNGELFRQVWVLLEQDFYGPDPSLVERTYGSVRGLIDSYGDAYTRFVAPQSRELERDQLAGRFGGIGAWIDVVEDGYALRPMPDSPAQAAGVQAGDRLVGVDGVAVDAGTTIDAIAALIRGPVGSKVCLDLRRGPAAESIGVCIVRAEIETPSVEWRLLDDSDGKPTIGYLKQTTFSERSADEMRRALDDLMASGATRFLLDLRGNPGGLVTAAVGVASLWLDGGPIYFEDKSDGSEQSVLADAGDLSQGAPLVVIVDGATASASEIVAGALQDRQRTVLLGERTFGKGSVQLVHELVDGSSLHVTTAHWFTPNHHAIEGVGLTPDVVIEPGSDPVPQAVALVSGRAAGQ